MQRYLDNIKAKTGKTVADFRVMASRKGLVRHGEIIAWLKDEFTLGHGHAQAIAACLENPDFGRLSPSDRLAALFAGGRGEWQRPCAALLAKVERFGSDVGVAANQTYVNLNRGRKKFALLRPSTKILDVGLKLKGLAASGRLEAAGSWSTMVTHRVRISDPGRLDAELLAWLRRAYDLAG